jgi:hypothetical protein
MSNHPTLALFLCLATAAAFRGTAKCSNYVTTGMGDIDLHTTSSSDSLEVSFDYVGAPVTWRGSTLRDGVAVLNATWDGMSFDGAVQQGFFYGLKFTAVSVEAADRCKMQQVR